MQRLAGASPGAAGGARSAVLRRGALASPARPTAHTIARSARPASPDAHGDGAQQQQQPQGPAPSAKYLRLLAFVDEHSLAAPQPLPASGAAVAPLAALAAAEPCAACSSSRHVSYDEEAEEDGCLLDEPHLLAASALAATRVDAAPAPAAPAGGDAAPAAPAPAAGAAGSGASAAARASVYASDYWNRRLTARAAGPSGRADGAALGGLEAAARRARRHSAADGAPRPCAHLGDLEAMSAWIDPTILAAAAEAQAAAAATGSPSARERYAAILAFMERSAALGPLGETRRALVRFRQADAAMRYRAPQSWEFTFDEDVHDCDECSALSSVLGSC